jgi:tetratricopeptide (TPR) repeat protein
MEYQRKHKKGNFDGTDGLLKLGQIQMAQGEHDLAVRSLQNAREKAPHSSEVNTALAGAYRAVKRGDEALEAIDKALTQNPNNVAARRVKILLLRDRGAWREAQKQIAETLKLRPGDPWLVRSDLEVLSRVDPRAAIERRRQIRRDQPDDLENLLRLANLYERDGQQQNAEEAYTDARRRHPKDLRTVVGLAHFLRRTKPYEEGLRHLQEFASSGADPADRYKAEIALGRYQAVSRKRLEAEQSFKRAVQLAPQELITHKTLGEFYRQNGQYELARDAYRTALKLARGREPESHRRLVECLLNLGGPGDLAQAESEIGQYVVFYPQDPAGYLLQALTVFNKGRNEAQLDKALRLIERALGMDQHYVEALYQKGRLLWYKQVPSAALDALRQAKGLAPRNMLVRLLKARIHDAERDTAEAVTELEDALKLVREQRDVMAELCRLYAKTGAFDKLGAVARRGVQLFAGEAIWSAYMGQYYESKRNWTAAEVAYGSALRHSKYEPQYVNQLLNVMSLAKHHQALIDRSLKIRQAAEAMHSRDPSRMPAAKLRRTQVFCLMRASDAYTIGLGKQTEGDDLLLKAMDIAIPDEPLRRWLYGLLLESDRRDKVVVLLERSLKANPKNHKMRLNLAWMYYRMEQYAKSEKLLEEVVAELPQEKQAWQQLSLVYYNLNKNEDAMSAFEAALRLGPTDFSTLNNFAWFLAERMGKAHHKRALELAGDAVALQPNSATVLDTLGWIQYLAGEPDKAIETLRRSMGIQEIAANAYHLAVVHNSKAMEQDRTLARNLANKAIALDPQGDQGAYGKKAKELLEGVGG